MQTKWQRAMLESPVFDPIRFHEQIKLAETSDPFPPEFNPHDADDVIYRAVSACVGTDQSTGKRMMSLHAFWDGIQEERIDEDTTIVESSSGNTGPEMQKIALETRLKMRLLLRGTMPTIKFNRARALCDGRVRFEEGNAHLAREMGTQPGFYCPDQYGRPWNPYAQATYLAPQVFKGNEHAAAIFVLGGSCGTPLGFARYVREHGLKTKVHMVLAAGKDDLSGGKNFQQVKDDILHDVFSVFPEKDILYASRAQANLLAWLSWPYVVKRSRGLQFTFGQSFGATVMAAFAWVEARKRDGTLDLYRGPDGKVVILTFGMDSFEGYLDIFLTEIKDRWLKGLRVLPLFEELFSHDL